MGSKLASAIRQRRAAVGVRGRWRLNLALVATSLSLLSLLAVPIAVRATSQSSSSTNGPVVPLYGQQWDPWGPQDLGTSSSSIANEGCALTASAMLLAAYGVNTNPGALNQWLISNGGYVDQDLLVWGAVAQFAQAQGVDVSFVSTQGYNLAAIDSSLAAGNPVIAQVTLDGNMHFVLITGTGPDGTLWMNDPWTGDHTTFQSRYGSPATGIDSIRIYSGPPAASASMTAMSAGASETITVPAGGLGTSGNQVLIVPYSMPTANWLEGTIASVVSEANNEIQFTAPTPLSAGYVILETGYGEPNYWFPFTATGVAPVTVSALSPNSGPAVGGVSVTIGGTGFVAPVSVTFGGVPATSVVLDTSTQLQALCPPGSGGQDVQVGDWMGSDTPGPQTNFSYSAVSLPAVGSVSPSGGSGAGGEEVVIDGSNFVGVSGVLFGATPAEGYQVESSSVIDAVAPPDPTGVVPVTVETAVGSSGATAGSDFTYTDPNGHAAVAQGDGVVDVFGQGESGGLEHYWYLPGGSWAGAQQLGSGLSSVPSATTSSSGVVSAFWQGTDGGLWYAQYTPGTGWQPAVALAMGTLGGAPQVVGQPSGTIDVFWRGANNQLWHAWQNPGGPWEGPQDLGGSMASDPSPTVSAPGQVDVLWKGSDGNLWLTAYQPGAGWMAPNDLGFGPLGGGPQAVGQSSGTIDVFWDGASGQLWHAWYNPGSAWAGPQDLGGTLASDPSPTVTSAGHVDVFWKGSDGNLWEAYYQPGGSWVSPVDLGFGPLGGGPHAAGQPSGTVDVFWLGYGNAELWHAWSLNGSTWAGPQNLGGSLSGL